MYQPLVQEWRAQAQQSEPLGQIASRCANPCCTLRPAKHQMVRQLRQAAAGTTLSLHSGLRSNGQKLQFLHGCTQTSQHGCATLSGS